MCLLGESGGINIILYDKILPECLPEAGQHSRAAPAGELAGQRHGVAPRVIHARAADDRLSDGRAVHPGFGAQRVGQPDQLGHPAGHARCPCPGRGLGADIAGQVGQRSAQVLQADVQA